MNEQKREIVPGQKPGDVFIRVVVHRSRHHWWEFWQRRITRVSWRG